MRLFFAFISIFLFTSTQAQEFYNYKRIQCEGLIPEDITQATSLKVLSDLELELEDNDSHSIKREKKDFLKTSNYELDKLLASGLILFGDPVTKFVNEVADKVLKDEPELRAKLRFYCVKSNVTNAFATNQGMIFITLGLISQLENEAQLAYVIAHEIHHFEEKHVIDSYLEKTNVNSNMRYQSSDDKIKYLSDYSKERELEADSSGFFRLKKTEYNLAEAYNVFDILQFSHLPFDEVQFDYSFIESELFLIPEKYKIDSINAVNFEDDIDDSRSSHPNVKKRRMQVGKFIVEHAKVDENSILSSDAFSDIRTQCRFEAIRINLKNREYVKAIYNSQIMLKNYPEDAYLQKSIAKALYGLSKYSNNRSYSSITHRYTKYEGEISAAYHLFEKLKNEHINSIAVRYLWKVKNIHPEDLVINGMLNDCIRDLYIEHDLDYSDFFTPKKSKITTESEDEEILIDDGMSEAEKLEAALNLLSNDGESEDEDSKYEKLRITQDIEDEIIEEELIEGNSEQSDKLFHLRAFVDVNNIDKLNILFEKILSEIEDEEHDKIAELEEYNNLSYTGKKEYDEIANQRTSVEKLVMVSPSFIDYHKDEGVRLEQTEEKTNGLTSQLNLALEKLGLELVVLDVKQLDASQVDVYNDIADYNNWAEEKMAHFDSFDDNLPTLMEGENMQRLIEKYGTDYFSYHWIIHENRKKGVAEVLSKVTFGALAFPLLPATFSWVLLPNYNTYYYSMVFDADSNEGVLYDYKNIKVKANQADINSWFYGMMLNLQYK